jgi:hypothetical protein
VAATVNLPVMSEYSAELAFNFELKTALSGPSGAF